MAPQILFTLVSSNAKTGPIPVSGSQAFTCPPACPFAPKDGKLNGCYAAYGPISWLWTKLNNGKVGFSFAGFLKQVANLPTGQLWRHNQFGDLKGKGNAICRKSLKALIRANAGKCGFTYTHKPVLTVQDKVHAASNRAAVKEANRKGFTVNLSGNNVSHADQLKKLGIAPVVSVVPADSPKSFLTPDGNKVIICPAQQRNDITCAKCGLCSKSGRSVIIGFIPHGSGAKHVQAQTN